MICRRILLAATLFAVAWSEAVAQGQSLRGTVMRDGRVLSNVVVAVIPIDSATFPAGDTTEIDQRELRFVPTIVAVGIGGAVTFRNSDPYLHNVYSPTGKRFTLGTYARGDTRVHAFETLGRHVILCNVHPEMVAYVFVVPSSHHAITDAAGRFAIRGIPPGDYLVQVWQARGPPFEEVVSSAQLRGERMRIEIGSNSGRRR